MATFRSVLYRWVFAGAVFCGSFTSLGAVFAPLSSPFQGSPDPVRLGPPVELKIVFDPVEAKLSSRRDVILGRLEELILTHRAISASV
ncbi:MAG: hypothetical protein ABH891_06385 [Candidatus Omnitrophota bacterium]